VPINNHKNVNIFFRHYKLEAEIASMTWKVNYNDIIRVPQEKWRTSMASLIRRNSQRVNDTIITFCCAFQKKKIIYRGKFVLNVRLRFHLLIFSVAFPRIHLFFDAYTCKIEYDYYDNDDNNNKIINYITR